MSNQSIDAVTARLARMMGESSRRSSSLHARFLFQRGEALYQIQSLIENQMRGAWNRQGESLETARVRLPALFESEQLDEFGTGKISRCFGPEFALYDNKRIPRIPNGDLKMMTRVTSISGRPRDFSIPAAIEVEYDVPEDAWFLRDSGSTAMPYSLLMETALQPCGFLSAYLDTYALVPHEAFYFRNLDGAAKSVGLSFPGLDLRGRTIVTRARLLTSVASAGTVIQKFHFQVGLRENGPEFDLVIYDGESTFGYFAAETMANQVGLDAGQQVPAWIVSQTGSARERIDLHNMRANPAQNGISLPSGRMGFIDQVTLVRGGGIYGQGYLHALRPVKPADWFYPYHFIGDPVMPGSLGVESMLEAMKAYALAEGYGNSLRSARFALPEGGPPSSWRYRGQITPNHKMMELDVHLKNVRRHSGEVTIAGDANIWVDGLRIYEVKDAAIRIIGE